MLYSIENEFLSISATAYGAELTNIRGKNDNTEFLWNGDPEFWKYHAPILFPIVGKVKDNKYKIDGNEYSLPQHGLGRLSKFKLIEKTDTSLSFQLDYSEDTLKKYPFKFSLIITYVLIGSTISVSYKVKNLDNQSIYFSIGAHPAYMCPLFKNEKLSDYYLEFSHKETSEIMLLNTSNGLFSIKTKTFLENENKIKLSKELFKNDALVFNTSELNSNIIYLKSKNHNKFIEFNFSNFPYLGLWSPTSQAPFICIEPWFGHADYETFNGDFKDKEGIITLPINQEFSCTYSVTINQ